MTKNYENILIEFPNAPTEDIAVLKINRPSVLNALNTNTLREMKEALHELQYHTSVRILIVTGSGDKAFIAGADISEMDGKNPREAIVFAQTGQDVTKLLEQFHCPVIAAVNGFALGGGTEMAISCDFILCSDSAVFGQPEVSLGLIPGFGATVRLPKFVGFPRAKELIFSGRKVDAAEALRIGLATHVFPRDNFFKSVMEYAQKISRNSLTALAASKRLLNEFSDPHGLGSKLDAEAQEFGGLFGLVDQIEGIKAFLEKRKPQFIGREK